MRVITSCGGGGTGTEGAANRSAGHVVGLLYLRKRFVWQLVIGPATLIRASGYSMAIYKLEDVFVTEGVPQYTFVEPPNYVDILIDVRKLGKPVIIEGQSGTGKTTAIKRIIQQVEREDVS
jgi:Cdc6-like AAA superfamily ATPase